jgi:hypothetical protein
MTRDQIIRMAREAGFEQLAPDIEDWVCFTEEIERFAALVAARDTALLRKCLDALEANCATWREKTEAITALRERLGESTRDEILRMAREAEFPITKHLSGRHDIAGQSVARFERFATLVAAAEREECAKLVEGINPDHQDCNHYDRYIAAAIRARRQA